MKTRIWIVRHGETDWNVQGRFQGQEDIPLNETGRLQAAALARQFETEQIEAVYTSDLLRASQTASAIYQMLCSARQAAQPSEPFLEKIQYKYEPRLREMNFGVWQGLTYTEIERRYSEALRRWESNRSQNPPPEGETLEEFSGRVNSAFMEICSEHPNGAVLLVGHGGSMKLLIAHALGLPSDRFWQFRMANASISELAVYPEGSILNRLNDTSHLATPDINLGVSTESL